MAASHATIRRGAVKVGGISYMAHELLGWTGRRVLVRTDAEVVGQARVYAPTPDGRLLCVALCPELAGPHEISSPSNAIDLPQLHAMMRQVIHLGGRSMANSEHSADLGFRVTWLRKKLHLSVEEVAEAIGVKPSTVRRYELGDVPRNDMLYRLACVLNTHVLFLLAGLPAIEVVLEKDEQELIGTYRSLSPESRLKVSIYATTLVHTQESDR